MFGGVGAGRADQTISVWVVLLRLLHVCLVTVELARDQGGGLHHCPASPLPSPGAHPSPLLPSLNPKPYPPRARIAHLCHHP